MPCTIITLELPTSSISFARFTTICDDRSSWSAIDCPAHRAAVRRLHDEGATWLAVEWLPPYAPDLDPVEDVWNQSKYADMANVVPDDIDDLRQQLHDVLETYRHEPNRLHSFFTAA